MPTPRLLSLFLIAVLGGLNAATAETVAETDPLPAMDLAPFVVNGDSLAVTIHARTKSDRRYAEKFADEVVHIAYDTLEGTASPGRGLIIVGDEGEPHPLWIFRKFLAMADAGQLQPAIAERAPELRATLAKWEEKIEIGKEESDVGLTFDLVVPALPFRLEGLGTRLYQVAWIKNFDVEQVEYAFHDLTPAELSNDRLARFHWVYFLPPRNAFDRVIDTVLPKVMDKEDMGFFTRTAVRGAIVLFKPTIRKALEGVRKGLLFRAILTARSTWSEDDIDSLTEAYIESIMPDFKFNDSRDATHARAMEAIDKRKAANAEYAKDPFITPERLATFDRADYTALVGDYVDKGEKETTHRFRITDEGAFHWIYKDEKTMVFYPAGPRTFVIEDGKMTIEFLVDDGGKITGVEERWKRRRKTVPIGE